MTDTDMLDWISANLPEISRDRQGRWKLLWCGRHGWTAAYGVDLRDAIRGAVAGEVEEENP